MGPTKARGNTSNLKKRARYLVVVVAGALAMPAAGCATSSTAAQKNAALKPRSDHLPTDQPPGQTDGPPAAAAAPEPNATTPHSENPKLGN